MAKVGKHIRCAAPRCLAQVAREGQRCHSHGGVLPMRFAEWPRCGARCGHGGRCFTRVAREGLLCWKHALASAAELERED